MTSHREARRDRRIQVEIELGQNDLVILAITVAIDMMRKR